ncbi:hypothetical protein VCHENC03_1782 [Vibrio sp. HENC-03]|nr:hypothetical protein VCHENC03_1782 [Vibrio sp. HENC-03]
MSSLYDQSLKPMIKCINDVIYTLRKRFLGECDHFLARFLSI